MEESILKRIWLRKWIQHVMNYEQGRVAIPLEKLYAIAETLSINITDLLIEEDEGSKVENELPDLIKEYKEIESQVMY